MRVWQLIVITYVTFVAQTSLVQVVEVGGVRPNLVVMGLLLLIPALSGRKAMLAAACWGLLSDAIAPTCPGIDLVCFTTAAFVLWHFQRRGISQTTIGRALLLYPSALLLICSCRGLREIASGTMTPMAVLVEEATMCAGMTAAFGSLILLFSVFRARRSGSSAMIPSIYNSWKMLTQ